MSNLLNFNDYIELKDSKHLLFKNRISFDTVPSLAKQLNQFYQQLAQGKQVINFDLSGVTELDTAGFCLICNMLNDLKDKYQIKITDSDSIHTYCELYDLEDFLAQFN